MKVAIISDIHLGCKKYRSEENGFNKFEQAGYDAIDKYVDIILSEKPDLVINAGDVFEKANPSILAMTKYVQVQDRLKDIPTMCILGNHDFSFANRLNNCSAAEMAKHTYFADYSLKAIEMNDILFVLMPYIYDNDENIKKYFDYCKEVTLKSTCKKKILITHGVTEKYYRDHLLNDHYMFFTDEFVSMFDFVIIGHVHTPFSYKQKNTIVLSPGAMIDYQAYEDRTGPVILDTDTFKFHKIKVKTPHIIKKTCNEETINELLSNVTEDIYHISYEGDVSAIDNDLFIEAKNKSINITIDVIENELENDENTTKITEFMPLLKWVKENYSDYTEIFEKSLDSMKTE